jgi:L-amino acid N-acyltransferase YncA
MDDDFQKRLCIRFASEKDLKEIIDIFNQGIRTRSSTGYLHEMTVGDRQEWFMEHTPEKYPILVAEFDNTILGWISLDPYRKGRKAFERTGEISSFVHPEYWRKGVGGQLLSAMMQTTKKLGYTTLLAIVLDKNTGSRKLLEKNDFEQWGMLPDVAMIDGISLSHVYYGKKL